MNVSTVYGRFETAGVPNGVLASVYLLKKGDKVVVTGGNGNLRKQVATSKDENNLTPKNTILEITGDYSYDQNVKSVNQFVWFPVKTKDGKSDGFISSAYIKKLDSSWTPPIVDNIKPIISGATSKKINMNSTFNPKTGVTAKDNVDGDLTSAMKVTSTVNTKIKGTYTVTYTVRDKSKNVAKITRKITVK